MKSFIVLLSLMLSAVCFAQGGGDRVGAGDMSMPILSVLFPSNPLMEVPLIRTVDIYSNGRVVETVIKNRGTPEQDVSYKLVTILSRKTLEKATACSSEFESQDFRSKPDDYCMDDSGVHYLGGLRESNFAVRYCGQLQSLATSCSKEMVKLLDKLSL
jgi:hypothetical protein